MESQPQNPEFYNNPEHMDPSSEAQFLKTWLYILSGLLQDNHTIQILVMNQAVM